MTKKQAEENLLEDKTPARKKSVKNERCEWDEGGAQSRRLKTE